MIKFDLSKMLICAGDVSLNTILPYGKSLDAVEKLKATGTCPVCNSSYRLGGSMGSTALTLGKLKTSPYLLSVVCPDNYGREIFKGLNEFGVDCSLIKYQEEPMPEMIAVIGKDSERIIYVHYGPEAKMPALSSSQLPVDLIPEIGWVHANGFGEEAIVEFMELCHKAGVIVSFDLNLRLEQFKYEGARKRKIERAVMASNIIFGSGAEEFYPLTGFQDLKEAALELSLPGDKGLRVPGGRLVIARDKTQPILVCEGSKSFSVLVHPVIPVNTMNSGDVFNGGFIAAIVKGKSIKDAVKWGCICSASAIQSDEVCSIPCLKDLNILSKNY